MDTMRTLEEIMIDMEDIMIHIGGCHEYVGDWELFSSLASSLTKYILYIETSDTLDII